MIKTLYALAAISAASTSIPASASLVVFSGEDLMSATISPHPNSTAAAADFDAAVSTFGGASHIEFETAPLGSFSNLTVAPGVSLSGSDATSLDQTIRNTSSFPLAPTLDGYNTTSGGSNFVEVMGGDLTFSFAKPIYGFGAYFSGIQTSFYPDAVTFSDGTTEMLSIPGAGTNSFTGGLSFLGFTDVGKSISSITLHAGSLVSITSGYDDIGIDDVRLASVPSAAAVPEAGIWLMMILGFGLIGGVMRRAHRRSEENFSSKVRALAAG